MNKLLLIALLIVGCDNSTEPQAEECVGVSDGTAVADIDGNCYATVRLGSQLWMAENLKVTHYQDSTSIPTEFSDEEWCEIEIGAYSVFPDSISYSYSAIYGNLYNWYAIKDSRGLCMEGWHVATWEEFSILRDFLGGYEVAAGKMKTSGTDYWYSPNTGATNESGFSALPGGHRQGGFGSLDGKFFGLGEYAMFWLPGNNFLHPWVCSLSHINSLFNCFWNANYEDDGLSIRCLKD